MCNKQQLVNQNINKYYETGNHIQYQIKILKLLYLSKISVRMKKQQTRFQTTRIKRIIQENQDIGKMFKEVPAAIQKSLEIFQDAICQQLIRLATKFNIEKLTLELLWQAIFQSRYGFLIDNFDSLFLKEGLVDTKKISIIDKEPNKPASNNVCEQGQIKKKQQIYEKIQENISILEVRRDNNGKRLRQSRYSNDLLETNKSNKKVKLNLPFQRVKFYQESQ